jgi:hypothetical protein
MRLEYKTTKAHLIKNNAELREQFRLCSFKTGGIMNSELNDAIASHNKNTKIVYCLHKHTVVGWGINFPCRGKHGIMLHVFLSYRRNGIGTKLFKRLTWGIKNKTKILCWPHNKVSTEFFKSVKVKA